MIYLLNNIILLSHLLNTITGGKHDHSFSARVGYVAMKGVKWAIIAQSIIDPPFRWIGRDNHCHREAIRMLRPVKF